MTCYGDDIPVNDSEPTPAPTRAWPELSNREFEVAQQLAIGKTNREIAEALGISIKTVDTHRGHLLKKLGCRNNVALARLAIRDGVTTLEAS